MRRLKIALPYADALEAIHADLKNRVEWAGRLTSNDILHVIDNCLRAHGEDLGRTKDYYRNPVYFDPDTVCKGCEHLVKFDGSQYCMNRKAFAEKNAEAQAAGLLPGGKQPDKPVDPKKAAEDEQEVKAEKRANTLERKCRDYLHRYLIDRIVRFMQTDGGIDITDELLAWHGMRRPGECYYDIAQYSNSAPQEFDAVQASGIGSIEQLLQADADTLDQAKHHAAVELAYTLHWRETQAICHQLWGGLTSVWSMDEVFCKLFQKAELIHLAETHKLHPSPGKDWSKMKLAELRKEILARADRVKEPRILVDIYDNVADPYKPPHYWNPQDDQDSDDGPGESTAQGEAEAA